MPALRVATALLMVFLTAAACAPASPSSGAVPSNASARGADAISPQDMEARIYFLASDALAGRDTWSPGLEAAAAYLVSEYRQLGLEPGGDNGTFYQRYPFRSRRGNLAQAPDVIEEETFPPNVIAVLPGSDPELRDEYVVLSAHFDHVGVGQPADGDSIYNGADDNGTGTAALLEVAKAFTTVQAPRRSVMFLHVSGEEHGLLGSQYYSENPTVPVDQIVANINVDMIGRNSPDSIVAIGKNYSSLGTTVNEVGARHPELGLTVSDDLWPEERFFYRSDHFNFARLEIPAIFFFAGVHEDYHRPSDTFDKIDNDKAARVARLIFHTVQELANAPGRPEWDADGLAEVRQLTR
ncbi:MAG: M28 family peptidase [Gemmatimonas sp.]|nr:M28 family peptidase [Gemmatimonas sp.]